MLQVFSKESLDIVLDNKDIYQNIDKIDNYIEICNCKNMTIDITNINIIDACMISVLCSTKHYLKYPDGKIKWIVNSKEIEDYTKSMKLGNGVFEVV